jgi:hypothetical protein
MQVKLPLIFQPSACEIVAEPLGVVLIFSTWNFPISKNSYAGVYESIDMHRSNLERRDRKLPAEILIFMKLNFTNLLNKFHSISLSCTCDQKDLQNVHHSHSEKCTILENSRTTKLFQNGNRKLPTDLSDTVFLFISVIV